MAARRAPSSKSKRDTVASLTGPTHISEVSRRSGPKKSQSISRSTSMSQAILAAFVQSSKSMSRATTPPDTPIAPKMPLSNVTEKKQDSQFKRPSGQVEALSVPDTIVDSKKRPLSPFSCPHSTSSPESPSVAASCIDTADQCSGSLDSALDLLSEEPFEAAFDLPVENSPALKPAATPTRSSGAVELDEQSDDDLADITHPNYLCLSFMTNLTCCNQSFGNLHDLEQHKDSKPYHEHDHNDIFSAAFPPYCGVPGMMSSFGPLMSAQPFCMPAQMGPCAGGIPIPGSSAFVERWSNMDYRKMASQEFLLKNTEPIFAHANCSAAASHSSSVAPVGAAFPAPSWIAPEFSDMALQTSLYRQSIDEIQKRLSAVANVPNAMPFSYLNDKSGPDKSLKQNKDAPTETPIPATQPQVPPNFRLDENEALIAMYRFILAGLLPPIPGCDPPSILAAAAASNVPKKPVEPLSQKPQPVDSAASEKAAPQTVANDSNTADASAKTEMLFSENENPNACEKLDLSSSNATLHSAVPSNIALNSQSDNSSVYRAGSKKRPRGRPKKKPIKAAL